MEDKSDDILNSLGLYMVTWNVACKQPESEYHNLLSLNDPEEKLPDFYAIGLQEVKAQLQNIVLDALFDDPWMYTLKKVLGLKNYVKLKTVRLQGIILSVFCKKKHLLHVRYLEVQSTKTGLSGFWGNKGCVAIRANIYGVSVCFVNTHLTAHDQNLVARVQDYNNIIRHTSFTRVHQTPLILYHDYVFWAGDHNFRLDEAIQHDEILEKIREGELDELRESDQLRMIMRSGQAFSELVEEPFHFPPTYKFHFQSSEYDSRRRPAWTDRILYKVNTHAYENVTLGARMEFYNSFPEYVTSDHKPVAGKFTFKVFRNYPDPIISFEPIQNWFIDEDTVVTFYLDDGVTVTDYDWIGVFKTEFSSLDEHLAFVYLNAAKSAQVRDRTPPNEEESPDAALLRSRRREVKFPEGSIRTAGRYCLLYFTSDSGSVLGVSEVFEATFKSGSMSVPWRRSSCPWTQMTRVHVPKKEMFFLSGNSEAIGIGTNLMELCK